jgi:hypothetical protein
MAGSFDILPKSSEIELRLGPSSQIQIFHQYND